MNDFDDIQIKDNAISLMQRILDEVGENYKDGLFVACALIGMNTLKIKQKRGRPSSLVYSDVVNKRGLGRPKSLIQNIDRSSKVGAPQKYDLKGMPTRTLARCIAFRNKRDNLTNYREAARLESIARGLTVEHKRIKQLAELAKRIDSE